MAKDKWIQGAINPAHAGFCSPMSKPTCTPRRRALAERFKHGDIHKANLAKGKAHRGFGKVMD